MKFYEKIIRRKNGSYPFANGLIVLNGLNGFANLCVLSTFEHTLFFYIAFACFWEIVLPATSAQHVCSFIQ